MAVFIAGCSDSESEKAVVYEEEVFEEEVDVDAWVGEWWPDLVEKEAANGFNSLQEMDQVKFGVNLVDAEVRNGGLDQFYRIASGDLIARLPSLFLKVGATRTASELKRINALFPGGTPAFGEDEREEQIEEGGEKMKAAFEAFDVFFRGSDDV
ncbi:MAG: DUF4375 domain-containing protein, partial [Verrucomicrobiota bacterium]